jgi:hypothetical protein
MTIIMTKPEFQALPESEQWAIVYNLEPEPEPTPKPEPPPEPVLPTVEGFWN